MSEIASKYDRKIRQLLCDKTSVFVGACLEEVLIRPAFKVAKFS